MLGRLAAVTAPHGVLMVSLKEGDGEGWSTHGAVTAPRRFVYWRGDPLVALTTAAGWEDVTVEVGAGLRGERWLMLTAHRSSMSEVPATMGAR